MPRKRSVALAVSGVDGGSRVILARRPMDDVEFPGMWGLPAASCREDETPKQTAQRVGMHKLGVSLVLGDVLDHGEQIRPSYILKMTLYRACLVDIEPRMPSTRMTSGGSDHDGDASAPTIYTGWRWGEPGELQDSARKGSLCSQLLLEKG